jgi:hypothetical protein
MRCDTCDCLTDEVEDDFGEVHCLGCQAIRNEAAYERFLDDHYGGSGPVSLREQMIEARRLK